MRRSGTVLDILRSRSRTRLTASVLPYVGVAAWTNPPDDGLLQVREIRSLHLNASLVTLSACNTGVGPVGEAGVADIGEAFIEAGAESVVSTLWKVADIPSKRLMTEFYARLSHNEEKGDALRHARLILEQSGMAPYYWAGFELVGDAAGTLSSPVLSTTFSRSIR